MRRIALALLLLIAPLAHADVFSRGLSRALANSLYCQLTGGTTCTLTDELVISASTKGVRERNRSVAMGEWTTPTFNAADFTGSGSMTWTLASGDVVTQEYTLIGKTIIYVINVQTATVGGTPANLLRVAIPGGFAAAKTVSVPAYCGDNTASLTLACVIGVTATATNVTFQKVPTAAWTASTDLNYVQGVITFEVQ